MLQIILSLKKMYLLNSRNIFAYLFVLDERDNTMATLRVGMQIFQKLARTRGQAHSWKLLDKYDDVNFDTILGI